MSTIAENVAEARRRIAAAAESAGRDPGEIRLLAATKMNDADRVREAIAAGVDLCGENRVQEFVAKNAVNAYAGCGVHFIGTLQKNKVKYLVGAVELIHSVDSPELMREIHRRAEKLGLVQPILLEVNIGGEVSKSGAPVSALPELLSLAGEMPGVQVRGLMAIPPAENISGENEKYFRRMYELFVDIWEKKYDNVLMTGLSMGMSSDYEDAVRCGATIVRLGTALFGPRNYDLQEAPRDGTLR